eukprot:scaffold267382_cov31-Tisochrysis_lutea.AAC.4
MVNRSGEGTTKRRRHRSHKLSCATLARLESEGGGGKPLQHGGTSKRAYEQQRQHGIGCWTRISVGCAAGTAASLRGAQACGARATQLRAEPARLASVDPVPEPSNTALQ